MEPFEEGAKLSPASKTQMKKSLVDSKEMRECDCDQKVTRSEDRGDTQAEPANPS